MTDTLISVEEAGQVFVDPTAYADDARFHAACALLRREDPVHLVEHPLYPSFWAVTRHADVHEIELHNGSFHNHPLAVLAQNEAIESSRQSGLALKTLVHIDDPDHK